MKIEKAILAVITTNQSKVSGGAPIFYCNDAKESAKVAANLEAITMGLRIPSRMRCTSL